MRFLDANIFIYAYYKPRKELSEKSEMDEGGIKKDFDKVDLSFAL